MTRDAEIHTLAAPYALHALPSEEVELFERHLADCSACRDEVHDLRETVAQMGWAATVEPPPELKERVLAEVASIRPLPPVVDDTGERDLASLGRTPTWRRWWPRVAVAAAAVLAVVSVVQGIRIADLNDDLQQAQSVGSQMSDLVAAPDVELVRSDNGANATVVMSRSTDMAVLVAEGMEPPPDDHVYQLWFIGDEARSAGVLGESDDGQVGPFAAQGMRDAGQLGITVEPDGGSEQPTTDPVMVIDLPV